MWMSEPFQEHPESFREFNKISPVLTWHRNHNTTLTKWAIGAETRVCLSKEFVAGQGRGKEQNNRLYPQNKDDYSIFCAYAPTLPLVAWFESQEAEDQIWFCCPIGVPRGQGSDLWKPF